MQEKNKIIQQKVSEEMALMNTFAEEINNLKKQKDILTAEEYAKKDAELAKFFTKKFAELKAKYKDVK